MASGVVNSLKIFSSLFRKRLALSYELSELYRPSINKHKDKLIELINEKARMASQSSFANKMRVFKEYYTLEMAPPSSAQELAKLKADLGLLLQFMKSGCFRFLTVSQAWLLILVSTEVGLWFYLGETIGKMHIVGYDV